MPSVSKDTFGPLVAYLVPGATALYGISFFSPTLRNWLAVSPASPPSIGGFLYLTLAALAAGMTVSAVRWVLIDTLHAHTGLRSPPLDFSRLGENVEAFELLIEIQYRHYLFFANMLVATAVVELCRRAALGWASPPGWIDLGFVAIEVVFYLASRDILAKYHARTGQLLSPRKQRPHVRKGTGDA
jgi:hypothetical protein